VPPCPSSDLLRRERMEVETGVVDLSDDSKLTRPEAQRYWYGASISEFLRALGCRSGPVNDELHVRSPSDAA
jgi:hypothetical protein